MRKLYILFGLGLVLGLSPVVSSTLSAGIVQTHYVAEQPLSWWWWGCHDHGEHGWGGHHEGWHHEGGHHEGGHHEGGHGGHHH